MHSINIMISNSMIHSSKIDRKDVKCIICVYITIVLSSYIDVVSTVRPCLLYTSVVPVVSRSFRAAELRHVLGQPRWPFRHYSTTPSASRLAVTPQYKEAKYSYWISKRLVLVIPGDFPSADRCDCRNLVKSDHSVN